MNAAHNRNLDRWIGALPSSWDAKKLKFLAQIAFSNVDKVSSDFELSVLLCNYMDVYKNEEIRSDHAFMEATASAEEIRRFSIQVGDVLITKDSETPNDIAVPAYVISSKRNLLCGYHLAIVRAYKGVNSKFLYYCFAAAGISNQLHSAANGVTRFGLSQYQIANSLFPLPPIELQTEIVAFLDKETAIIDNLVSKKQQMIHLLQEKKLATISEIVNKGLDSSVEMKRTNHDWLGSIPCHWQLKRLRFAAVINPSKSEIIRRDIDVSFVPMEKIGEDGILRLEETRPLEEVYKSYTYFRNNDVLLAKITPCFENGKGALALGLANGIGCGTTELHVIRPKSDTSPNYIWWLTRSFQFREVGEAMMQGAAGQKRVPESFLKDLIVALPPYEEQVAIASHLENISSKLTRAELSLIKQISKLKEYKRALITAAVTGKIEVMPERNGAA